MLNIQVEAIAVPRQKPQPGDALGFGRLFTDHMFRMDYDDKTGWHSPRILPYQDICLPPAAAVFHYAQGVFEGMKAYASPEGKPLLFRPEMNAKRFRNSCERLCIPAIEEEDFLEAVRAIVRHDAGWLPTGPGSSLYVRPFIIATEGRLGLLPSSSYQFNIILSPSDFYYSKDLQPVSLWVEDSLVRAAKGGMGYAKSGGNYAVSLKAQQKARELGYDQVLWLDAKENKYVEEVGAMNVFFRIDDRLFTPPLEGSILPGVTRDSVIQLCRDWGYSISEVPISIEELTRVYNDGQIEEAFGTGTAAVIAPIGKVRYRDDVIVFGDGGIGPLCGKLYETLVDIQYGRGEDVHGWSVSVEGNSLDADSTVSFD